MTLDTRVYVRMDSDLVEQVDAAVARKKLKGRSELIREALRQYLARNSTAESVVRAMHEDMRQRLMEIWP